MNLKQAQTSKSKMKKFIEERKDLTGDQDQFNSALNSALSGKLPEAPKTSSRNKSGD